MSCRGCLHARRRGSALPCPRLASLSAARLRRRWHRLHTHTRCAPRRQQPLKTLGRGQPLLPPCPGPGQEWGSCALHWEGTSAHASTARSEEGDESEPRGLEQAWPDEVGARNPCGQRLCVAELVLALGTSLVPPSPDQAWGTGCIYIFVGYFALIKAAPALTLPPRLPTRAAGQGAAADAAGASACCVQPHCAAAALQGPGSTRTGAAAALHVPVGPGAAAAGATAAAEPEIPAGPAATADQGQEPAPPCPCPRCWFTGTRPHAGATKGPSSRRGRHCRAGPELSAGRCQWGRPDLAVPSPALRDSGCRGQGCGVALARAQAHRQPKVRISLFL